MPRSGDQTTQAGEYSGKAKAHTSKKQVLCDDVGYVHFLSWTYEGKVQDKALADASQKLVNQSVSTMLVVVEYAIGGIKRLHCLGHTLRLVDSGLIDAGGYGAT